MWRPARETVRADTDMPRAERLVDTVVRICHEQRTHGNRETHMDAILSFAQAALTEMRPAHTNGAR